MWGFAIGCLICGFFTIVGVFVGAAIHSNGTQEGSETIYRG